MKQRCTNPNSTHYARYGGRGIMVCQRWTESFEAFLADMGRRPSKRHTLERENNDGHYEPGNVRWATRKEQAQNRATNRLVRYNGKTQTVAQWLDELGLDEDLVRSRFRLGWTFDQIVSRAALPQRNGRPRNTRNGRFEKT